MCANTWMEWGNKLWGYLGQEPSQQKGQSVIIPGYKTPKAGTSQANWRKSKTNGIAGEQRVRVRCLKWVKEVRQSGPWRSCWGGVLPTPYSFFSSSVKCRNHVLNRPHATPSWHLPYTICLIVFEGTYHAMISHQAGTLPFSSMSYRPHHHQEIMFEEPKHSSSILIPFPESNSLISFFSGHSTRKGVPWKWTHAFWYLEITTVCPPCTLIIIVIYTHWPPFSAGFSWWESDPLWVMMTRGRYCPWRSRTSSPAKPQMPPLPHHHLPYSRWRPYHLPSVQASILSITSGSSCTAPHPEVLEIPSYNYFSIYPLISVPKATQRAGLHHTSYGLRFQLPKPVSLPSASFQKHSPRVQRSSSKQIWFYFPT